MSPFQLIMLKLGKPDSATSVHARAVARGKRYRPLLAIGLIGTLTVTDGVNTANITLLGQYIAPHLTREGQTGVAVGNTRSNVSRVGDQTACPEGRAGAACRPDQLGDLCQRRGICGIEAQGAYLFAETETTQRSQGSVRPKFTTLVACPGASGKRCCPADYAWDKQNRMCQLGSSFRPDPVP
jgi:hypothetical protein